MHLQKHYSDWIRSVYSDWNKKNKKKLQTFFFRLLDKAQNQGILVQSNEGRPTADGVAIPNTLNPSDLEICKMGNSNTISRNRSRTNNWGHGTANITVGDNQYSFTTFDGRFVFQNTFNGKHYGPEATQTDRITAYLSNGYTINQAAALRMFGCKNLRAAMSVIRAKVERFGNWRIIVNDEGTEYSMKRVVLIDPQDAADLSL